MAAPGPPHESAITTVKADQSHPDVFKMPSAARDLLLPSPDHTITDLLSYQFPKPYQLKGSLKAEEFFSQDQPTSTDPNKIRCIPMPTTDTLQKLIAAAKALCKDGQTTSIKCIHIQKATTHRLPLWVMEYWSEANEVRTKHFDPWRSAVAMMERREQSWETKNPSSEHALIRDIHQLLVKIKYQDNVRGFERDLEPISSLPTYLTEDWFSTTHENQMLEVLQRNVLADAKLRESVEIVDLHFFQMLQHAYNNRGSSDYLESRYATSIRELGQELAVGLKDIVGGIVHVGGMHWAAVVIDFKNREFLYGDSQGDGADPSLLQVVDWWTEKHTSECFVYNALPITYQTDGHSCGLLAFNAIAHRVAPHLYPLIAMGEVDDGRLMMLQKIGQIHLLNV